jgi:hypothetical protein
VTINPANAVFKFPPVVLDTDSMLLWVIVMPQWLTERLDSVELTVTTGSQSASTDLGIDLLPFFLEEGGGKLR